MSYINIALYVIIGLGAIFGFIKGFSHKRLQPFLFTAGGFAAYMFGVPLSRLLMNTRLGYDFLQNAYLSKIADEGVFSQVLAADYSEQIVTGLTELKVPKFFQGIFIPRVLDTSSTVRVALASSFANVTMIGICFAIIFLVVYFALFAILRPLWSTVFGEEGKNFIGRLFGIVVSLAKTVSCCLVILALISLVNQLLVKYNVQGLNDFLIKDLNMDNPESFSLGRFFYNTACSLLLWIM